MAKEAVDPRLLAGPFQYDDLVEYQEGAIVSYQAHFTAVPA